MTTLDGLAALDQEAEAKRPQRRPPRYVPSPKRRSPDSQEAAPPATQEPAVTEAAPTAPITKDSPQDAAAAHHGEELSAAVSDEARPAPIEAPTARQRPTAGRSQSVPVPPKSTKDDGRVTAYLDPRHLDFLDDVRFNSVRRRLRVDVSGSAVVRFALERLAAEMQPHEVYEAIAAKPVDEKAVGRKRR
jgi:hypothetical protein